MGFAEQNVDLGLAAVALQMSVAYVKGKFLSLCSLHLTEWFYISCKCLAFIQDSQIHICALCAWSAARFLDCRMFKAEMFVCPC